MGDDLVIQALRMRLNHLKMERKLVALGLANRRWAEPLRALEGRINQWPVLKFDARLIELGRSLARTELIWEALRLRAKIAALEVELAGDAPPPSVPPSAAVPPAAEQEQAGPPAPSKLDKKDNAIAVAYRAAFKAGTIKSDTSQEAVSKAVWDHLPPDLKAAYARGVKRMAVHRALVRKGLIKG